MVFNSKRFAAWMKEARGKNDISLYALAPRAQMHPTGLAKIETGEQDLRMSSFIKICHALGRNPVRVLNEMMDVL